jgi:hypothetical protein
MIRTVKIDTPPARVKDSLMSDLESAIGSEGFQRLVGALGGRQLYIPKAPVGPHHPIVQAAGEEVAAILIREFPGLTVMLPVTERKRALIKAGLEAGDPVLRIAQRVLCSPRFVWKVKAEISQSKSPTQPSLF